MPLPPRIFNTISEAAARWGCTRAEIFGWACAEQVALTTGIPPVTCGDRVISGMVQIHAADIFKMFQQSDQDLRIYMVGRVANDVTGHGWNHITRPSDGVGIGCYDLVIMTSEMERFEEAHDIFKRGAAVGGGVGPDFKHGWHEMLQMIAVHLHDEGVPKTQEELVEVAKAWFIDRSPDGEHPSERSIRRYLAPIWKALRKDCA